MLLFYVTVLCSLYGSSAELIQTEMCSGSHFTLPNSYMPPHFTGKLYLTSGVYGYKRLLMDSGESKDPRLKLSNGSARITDFTRSGIISVAFPNGRQQNVIEVTVKDCTTMREVLYGEEFTCSVPRWADYLEFAPLNARGTQMVVWRRTNPEITMGDRGQMKHGVWRLDSVRHADSGDYNFRTNNGALLSTIKLEVEVQRLYYEIKEGENFNFRYPPGDTSWDVTFESQSHSYRGVELLIHKGHFTGSQHFEGRFETYDEGFDIGTVQTSDSGIWQFRDQNRKLAQVVEFTVFSEVDPVYVSVGIGVGVVLSLIICCCCVRKCCCKKSSSKSDAPAPETAAAPAVYYHGAAGHAGPSYSAAPTRDYSYTQNPTHSLASGQSTTVSVEPSVNNPVNLYVSTPQPGAQTTQPSTNVAPPGEGFNLSLGSDWLSSNPEPTFQLKGMPSASPLSADATFSSVYTSDKLNFE